MLKANCYEFERVTDAIDECHILIFLDSLTTNRKQLNEPSTQNHIQIYMNSIKLVIPLHFISFRYILFHDKKKTPKNNAVTQRQSQFTPKMKANAVPRLLSSLV